MNDSFPRRLKHICLTLSIAALAACQTKTSPGIVIQTPQGPVQGITTENNIQNILGIPYAAPPVGNLRWRPPAPSESWSDIRDASHFSKDCMQPRSSGGGFVKLMIEGHGLSGFKTWLIKRAIAAQIASETSEDCLYLNIRTPNITTDGSVKGDPLPVMVWIHGGGHQFGSSDTDLYQSDDLPKKGVVLVTIKYRLGAFGYLAHPALSEDDPRGVSGNYGTLDQIAALKWVQSNIAAYGGDPNNITIFGESAGSWSVTEMMTTPLAQGLFHKAIGQSGASSYHMGQLDYDPGPWPSGHENGVALANALDLDNPSAEELRAVDAGKIIGAVTEPMTDLFHHVRDGVVFKENVGIAFGRGNINSVPAIFGYNSDESTVFFPDDPEPTVWVEGFPTEGRAAQIAALKPHFGDASETVIDLYNLDDPAQYFDGGTQMMGDEFFGINIRFAGRNIEKTGQPVYLYNFARVPPNPKQTVGAFHIAEIPFVFGSEERALGWSDEDEDLSELMQAYWVNFAKTGNPNGTNLPEWPTYQSKNWMQFGANNDIETGAITNYRQAKLDALETALLSKLDAVSRLQTPPEPDGSGPQSSE